MFPRPRWQALLIILAVWVVLVGAIRLTLAWDNAVLFLATTSANIMMAGVLFLWLTLRAGLPRWLSRTLWTVVLVALVSLAAIYRYEGVAGDMVPIFGPRFLVERMPGQAWPNIRLAPRRDAIVAAARAEKVAEPAGGIDLLSTTPLDAPQFLGPHRNAVSATATTPDDWEPVPRILWQHACGAGWSSFAVVGNYAITMEQLGEFESTVCYDLTTGEVCWMHQDPVRFESAIGGDGPRATPTIHDGKVYTFGAKGILNCLDGATGKRLWTVDVLADVGVGDDRFPTWGKSCSPLIDGDRVIVSAGGSNGQSLVAYYVKDGVRAWSGGNAISAYASPTIMELAGVRQIVILNAQSLAGHDPETGEVLWEFPWDGSEPKVPNPVQVGPNRILALAGYGLGCKLIEVGVDSTGHWTATMVWPSASRELKPKFTNVVVHRDHVFGIDDGRALICLDPQTGKRVWRGGRYGHGQILLSGDLLIVQAETGEVAIVAADPDEFREITRFNALPGRTWNNPVLAGNRLLVRNDQEVICFELAKGE